MNDRVKHKWWILAIVTLIGLGIDLLTKHLASTGLQMGRPVPLIGDFLQLMLVYNRGAIFGFDPRRYIPGFPLEHFFLVFNLLAMTLLILYYRSLKTDPIQHWGIALILPGALGNLSDRVLYPGRGVVDFIRVGISEEIYWPIFNAADAYVTVGVGLIMLSYFLEERRRVTQKDTAALPSENPVPPAS